MLVGYMRVSSENDRQVFDLQYDALIKEGVDPRHIFQDKISGATLQYYLSLSVFPSITIFVITVLSNNTNVYTGCYKQ